jgi:ABC-type transporter Mla MlaB component
MTPSRLRNSLTITFRIATSSECYQPLRPSEIVELIGSRDEFCLAFRSFQRMTTHDGTGPAEREAPCPARPPPEPSTSVLILGGNIARQEIPALCERARQSLECGAGPVDCDVGAMKPDAVTVEALARLQLTARRLGRRIRFEDAPPELQRLLGLMGLDEVLPCGAASGVEPSGQAEEREQARGVQEEGDPGDPAA